MVWNDLHWRSLFEIQYIIVSHDVRILAAALAHVLVVVPDDTVLLHSAPVVGQNKSIRVFSKNPFEGSVQLPRMSCVGLACSLLEICHKSGEARYFPPEKEGYEKGWKIMKGKVHFFPPIPCAIACAEWFGGQEA